MKKIAYIVCLWCGPRTLVSSEIKEDPLYYVKKHIEALTTLQHSISKIVFVINNSCSVDDVSFLLKESKLTNYEILVHDNTGISYGAWDYALRHLKDEVDYSILIEDDYLPVVNNFDDVLVDYLKDDDNTFYVCQASSDNVAESSHYRLHPAVSNGAIDNSIFNHCLSAHDHGFDLTGSLTEHWKYQLNYLSPYLSKGYMMVDILSKYRVKFLTCPPSGPKITTYGNSSLPDLFVPIFST